VSADVLLADAVIDRDLLEIEARALVDSIRADITDVGERIATAYLGRAWIALGYADWDSLCDAEFEGARLRVPREVRAELVQSLSAAGLSTRAAAKALGVGKSTINRDMAGVPSGTGAPPGAPERGPVIGQDGKQYAPTQPPRPQSSPLPEPVAPVGAQPSLTGGGEHEPGAAASEAPASSESLGDAGAPPVNPLAAARAEVAKQPAMLAGKGIERLRTARLTFEAAGSPAEVIADLVNDGLDVDRGHDWLAELDITLPLLNDFAAALRRRNLRSVRP
jgi:hypothetical protein